MACPWLSTALGVGPSEAQEEGTGIAASDVVKAMGEDYDPGSGA